MKYNSLKAREKQKKRNKEIADFLKEHPGATLMEVGKKYDLTKQRVHQIIVKQTQPQESGKIRVKQ